MSKICFITLLSCECGMEVYMVLKSQVLMLFTFFFLFSALILAKKGFLLSIIHIPFTPGFLIRITAICMNISTPILCGLLIYMNYFFLPKQGPKWYKPRISSLIILTIIGIIYFVIALWYLILLVKD